MVEAIGVSDGQSMRRVLMDSELAAGYEGGGPASGKFERGVEVQRFCGARSDGGNHHVASNATAPASREVA